MSIRAATQAMRSAVEAGLVAIVEEAQARDGEIAQMVRYHFGLGAQHARNAYHSKRLRPILLLTTFASLRGDWEPALPAAVALECLHGFSLIHDDIVDGSALRRGRPSVWAVWGTARALNAGDALFALAFRALFQLGRHFEASRVLEAQDVFTRACMLLAQGQELDLAYEEADVVSLEDYFAMAEMKTGSLFAAALEMAAVLANMSEGVRANLREAGRKLGLAFQIRDDLNDVFGADGDLGKPCAQDLKRGKKAFPVVMARHLHSVWWTDDPLEAMVRLRGPMASSVLERARAVEEALLGEVDSLMARTPLSEFWRRDIAHVLEGTMRPEGEFPWI